MTTSYSSRIEGTSPLHTRSAFRVALGLVAVSATVTALLAADFENPVPPGEPASPPWNESTRSLGVFRLVLDTNAPWWNPALLAGYPGYNPGRYTLTSPMLSDSTTKIGRSKA